MVVCTADLYIPPVFTLFGGDVEAVLCMQPIYGRCIQQSIREIRYPWETKETMAENTSSPELEPEDVVERELDEPRRYKVLMHNDDYTGMEFVVEVLMHIFHKNEAEANLIMMNIHKNGVGLCGIYTAEIAETKVSMVHSMAHSKGYPLKCTMEEV